MAAAARLPLEVDHAHSLWQEGQLGTSEYHLVSGVKRSSDALCWWVGSKMCAIDGSFNIFVISGDARGRVFSWSVAEQPGRGMADHWLKDEAAEQCVGCHIRWDHKSSIHEQLWHSLSHPDSRFTSAAIIVETAGWSSAANAAASSRRSRDFDCWSPFASARTATRIWKVHRRRHPSTTKSHLSTKSHCSKVFVLRTRFHSFSRNRYPKSSVFEPFDTRS